MRPTREAHELFLEGSSTLAEIESNGIKIDTDYLKDTKEKTLQEISDLESELRGDPIYKAWQRRYGLRMKFSAPEQLATILAEEFGNEDWPKTAKGRYVSDDEVFQKVQDCEFVDIYRRVTKLQTSVDSFINGILREVSPEGFLHCFFGLAKAITYRSNSDKINFQNFPIRNPEVAKLVRSCFVPRNRKRLIAEIDLSGAEVRVAACYNKDPVLINYIMDPTTDMHRDMACELFLLEKDQVDKRTTRDSAKNQYVFPSFYGSDYINISAGIWESMELRKMKVGGTDISIREHLRKHGIKTLGKLNRKEPAKKGTFEYHVKRIDDKFWNHRFSVYRDWKRSWFNKYQRQGWFRSLTGFVYTGIYSYKDASNYPIQGSAFHCLLWVLIRLQRWLRKNKMKTLVVGQIHDSIVLDAHPDELDEVLAYAKKLFTVKLPAAWDWLIVPIEVEAEVAPPGAPWYEKQKVKL
jgi:DNA polymerase I